jgi:RimJ/RimL family protein N-acetyltransferase
MNILAENSSRISAPPLGAHRPERRLRRITATILPDNHEVQHVCRKVGFKVRHVAGEGECQAELVL